MFTDRSILRACSVPHHTACRNENGKRVLSQVDVSASLTCPYLRLHVSGFGMGEADSPCIGVTRAGVLGQGGLLPEKPTL